MFEAFIYTEEYGKKILWKIELVAKIKGKEIRKENSGYIEQTEDKSKIATIFFSMLKKKEIELEFYTNDEELFSIFKNLNSETKLNIHKTQNSTSFDEMKNFIEENDADLPNQLMLRLQDLKRDSEFIENMLIASVFLNAYLFFSENPEKTKEIPLLKDLKKEGKVEKDIMMEDILSEIEEKVFGG